MGAPKPLRGMLGPPRRASTDVGTPPEPAAHAPLRTAHESVREPADSHRAVGESDKVPPAPLAEASMLRWLMGQAPQPKNYGRMLLRDGERIPDTDGLGEGVLILTAYQEETYAIVSPEDEERVREHRWHIKQDRNGLYAYANIRVPGSAKHRQVGLHNFLTGIQQADRPVDHRNRNTLDNRRLNIKPGTRAENAQNHKLQKNSKTGYRNVRRTAKGRYEVKMTINGKTHHVGTYDDPFIAAQHAAAYRKANTTSID